MKEFLVTDTMDEEAVKAISSSMDVDRIQKQAPQYCETPLSILLYDGDIIIAGLTGKTFWDWLYVDMLWVDKKHRQQDLGTEIVKRAEQEAIKRGCYSAYLWTESFEAPDFYSKLGYKKFVEMQNFPKNHQRIGFMKQLAP